MKFTAILLALVSVLYTVESFSPQTKTRSPVEDLQRGGLSIFAAFTIASNVILAPPPADAVPFALTSSSVVVAERVVREGIYKEYEIDVQPQQVDDARSTFKSAGETKSNKGKYTALLAILIVGSFIIPMAQYFWYVRDDDSSERFFGKAPEPVKPPPPPKKKGWFN